MPPGVQGATVFTAVATGATPTPPENLADWFCQGSTGRGTFEVTLPAGTSNGATAFVTAYFFNGRKQSGFACQPVMFVVQGGVAVPQGAAIKMAA